MSGPRRFRGEICGNTLGCGSRFLIPRRVGVDGLLPPLSLPKRLVRENDPADLSLDFMTIAERLVCMPHDDVVYDRTTGVTVVTTTAIDIIDEILMIVARFSLSPR